MISFEDGKIVLRQQFMDENGNYVLNSVATENKYNTNEVKNCVLLIENKKLKL